MIKIFNLLVALKRNTFVFHHTIDIWGMS